MATLYGDNATLRQNRPEDKIDVTEQHGRMRILKDAITLAAELTAGDKILMGAKLPAGAMIVEAALQSPQLGTVGGAGELSVGWQAGADGVEAADVDGLFAAVEVGSASANVKLSDSLAFAGYLKKFSEEVQLEITANETTDAGIGDEITLVVYYVVD